MAGTATVTGKAGPNITQTAVVYSNVTFFGVDTDAEILTIVSDGKIFQIDVSTATTWTLTVSGSTYTLTVS